MLPSSITVLNIIYMFWTFVDETATTVILNGASDIASSRANSSTTFGTITNNSCPQQWNSSTPQIKTDDFIIRLQHRLFETTALVPALLYQVMIVRNKNHDEDIEFIMTSFDSELNRPFGKFIKRKQSSCIQSNQYSDKFQPSRHNITVDWLIDGSDTGVVSFNFSYRFESDDPANALMYTINTKIIQLQDNCVLYLKRKSGILDSSDLPMSFKDCHIYFPHLEPVHGLVVQITRLNVPCLKGRLHFYGGSGTTFHYCGKLEELTSEDRKLYFSSVGSQALSVHSSTNGGGVFQFNFRIVDYCYNVTLYDENATIQVQLIPTLDCTFRIHLPFGYRVAINLRIVIHDNGVEQSVNHTKCPNGLHTEIFDGVNKLSENCMNELSVVGKSNTARIHVLMNSNESMAMAIGRGEFELEYHAVPIDDVVGLCDFGWVALKPSQCVAVFHEERLSWEQAEHKCNQISVIGGHLVSIQNDYGQSIIDNLITNSPGYRSSNAYWIGATDTSREGHFRWTDELPLSYTYWFPGWSEYGNYNKQPNDDGLSQQNCVEIRKTYSPPSHLDNIVNPIDRFMWNDRDCLAANYYICERRLTATDVPDHNAKTLNCNQTIELKDVNKDLYATSPEYPHQYPDNIACETVIISPSGYRIILDFEEFHIENEPMCSYDSLSLIEAGNITKTLCGDWTKQLKLLRYISGNSTITLYFTSDYSYHYTGYKVKISIENPTLCSNDRLVQFNNSCYLFVSYPEVNWKTAEQICINYHGNLVQIETITERSFIQSHLNNDHTQYWLAQNSTEHCLTIKRSEMKMVRQFPLRNCSAIAGFICKQPLNWQREKIVFNRTIRNESTGNITTPIYPEDYKNNVDFQIVIIVEDHQRIILEFKDIDIEYQTNCTYDFVQVESSATDGSDVQKFCGQIQNIIRFTSITKQILITFHSDYSITGRGFNLHWNAVDVSMCPEYTITSKHGVLTSPNYPNYLLSHLNCTITILAPSDQRIWVDFDHYDMIANCTLQLQLGNDNAIITPFKSSDLITDGTFTSYRNVLKLHLMTSSDPVGIGFKVHYRILSSTATVNRIITIKTNETTIRLGHLNYPNPPPNENVDYRQILIGPLGTIIQLQVLHMILCPQLNTSYVEIYDYYNNGSNWKLCPIDDKIPMAPITFTSYLNSLHIRQWNGTGLNGSLRMKTDEVHFKHKLIDYPVENLDVCNGDNCRNGGKCVQNFCQCTGHYIGIFCVLTECDLEPCLFGTCLLTNTSYLCQCQTGYTGTRCDRKRLPCETNPCTAGRGVCYNRGVDSFYCQCHAWWEGERCEKRMLHIPYKPLSERMFEEPFWLGLMTVFIVMAVIGLVWCAKRHFPEKIEKLLASATGEDGIELNRTSVLRPVQQQSVLPVQTQQQQSVPPPTTVTNQKFSIFNRLNKRKQSVLLNHSVTSPRAFSSLDDLVKSSMKNCSPQKKRTNSTPTTTSDKKDSCVFHLTERTKLINNHRKVSTMIETRFNTSSQSSDNSVQSTLTDPRLEKKVTFARLLNKVSAEMKHSTLNLNSNRTGRQSSISTPQSPVIEYNGNSLPPTGFYHRDSTSSSSTTDLLVQSNHSPSQLYRKPISTDSIFAMFRNCTSAGQRVSGSSSPIPTIVTPPPPPHDDDEECISTASSAPEYPCSIEVPVLDPLHTSSTSSITDGILLELPTTMNKCLSPIREIPTPLPSPMLHRKSDIEPKINPIPTLTIEIPSPIVIDNPWLPMITVTTDLDDDNKTIPLDNTASQMSYLSPFSCGTSGGSGSGGTASEINLSSSGYSSMASPASSRCGSNNVLYSNEMEDPDGPDSPLNANRTSASPPPVTISIHHHPQQNNLESEITAKEQEITSDGSSLSVSTRFFNNTDSDTVYECWPLSNRKRRISKTPSPIKTNAFKRKIAHSIGGKGGMSSSSSSSESNSTESVHSTEWALDVPKIQLRKTSNVKPNKLRTISQQIRFLKRLEQSLLQRKLTRREFSSTSGNCSEISGTNPLLALVQPDEKDVRIVKFTTTKQ